MNISLPEGLKAFVDEQVNRRGYSTSSEYVRELIRRDQDRLTLQSLVMEGGISKPGRPVSAAYFSALRQRVRRTLIARRRG